MKQINSGKISAGFAPALFLLVLIFSPAQTFAQEEGPPPQGQAEGRQPNPDGDLIRKLNLTPDQIEKIKVVREQNRDARREIGQRIVAARIALDRAIYIENADEAVVEERARELSEAQAAQVRLQAMTELRVRRILTPAQLETFLSLREQAENNRRNRRLQQNGERRPDDNRNFPPPRDRGMNGPGQIGGPPPGGGGGSGGRRGRP